jgi:hydroxymethylbilane synthase
VTLRLGTRGSALALAQSNHVATALTARLGERIELVEITTAGDRSTAPVRGLGVGVFVSALRDALLAKEIDLAVHSYKDLPTAPADGLTIAAVPARADPRDALVAAAGRTLAELPAGALVGTGAPRRVAQLLALGHGLRPVAVRGNVDTRLGKLAAGQFDAVVLARAGLVRLGRADAITEILDPLLMLPAPAQGALAVECREDDVDLREHLAVVDDGMTRAAVTAERALLAALEAGCSAPVAALAEVAEGEETADGPAGGTELEIYLRGGVFSEDGSFVLRRSRTAPAPLKTLQATADQVGRALAADLLAEGAETVLGVHHDPQS